MIKCDIKINSSFSLNCVKADNCEMLNVDGKLVEIDEKYMAYKEYSDVADKNVSMKMGFWSGIANKKACEDVCAVQALVRIDDFKSIFDREKSKYIFFVEKFMR